MEIPTWFPLLYKNFGCAEPLLSWLQREEQGLSVQHLCEDARSWPIQQPRAPDTVPKAHTRNNKKEKKKKKKDAGLAESCLFCAGLQLEERSFCACCLNGRERRERVWTPEGFLFSALDFSAFCFGRFVTRPQSACCDSSNHNSRVRLAITRDELFYFGALLDKQAECIMTGVKEPLVWLGIQRFLWLLWMSWGVSLLEQQSGCSPGISVKN